MHRTCRDATAAEHLRRAPRLLLLLGIGAPLQREQRAADTHERQRILKENGQPCHGAAHDNIIRCTVLRRACRLLRACVDAAHIWEPHRRRHLREKAHTLVE